MPTFYGLKLIDFAMVVLYFAAVMAIGFWAIDAVICSRLEVVSSTAAACSLVPWDSPWAVAETCPEADDSEVAPERAK